MIERVAEKIANGGDTSEFYASINRRAKLGRLVEPDEVVELALFLASDRSRMITGQSIAVDGGAVP